MRLDPLFVHFGELGVENGGVEVGQVDVDFWISDLDAAGFVRLMAKPLAWEPRKDGYVLSGWVRTVLVQKNRIRKF